MSNMNVKDVKQKVKVKWPNLVHLSRADALNQKPSILKNNSFESNLSSSPSSGMNVWRCQRASVHNHFRCL